MWLILHTLSLDFNFLNWVFFLSDLPGKHQRPLLLEAEIISLTRVLWFELGVTSAFAFTIIRKIKFDFDKDFDNDIQQIFSIHYILYNLYTE